MSFIGSESPAALRLAQAIEFVPRRQRQGDGDVRGVGLIWERHLRPADGRSVEVVGFVEHEVCGREWPKKPHIVGRLLDCELRRNGAKPVKT